MPIYEFYCPDCHTIFSFHSWRVNTDKRPACPRCGRIGLDRKVSRFAISKGRPEPSAEAGDVDEARLENAMESLAGDIDSIDESDPKAMARFMRKLYDAAGLAPGGGFEEAMRRLEAGEDPDAIEEELGDALEQEDPFGASPTAEGAKARLKKRLLPPAKDETLYSL